MRVMKLKQIGRHYFNPSKPTEIPQHSMQLWPGFTTAIHEYEAGAMLNIDLAHKVLRTDSVLDHINNLRKKFRHEAELKDAAGAYLVGQVVLTRYACKKKEKQQQQQQHHHFTNLNVHIATTTRPTTLTTSRGTSTRPRPSSCRRARTSRTRPTTRRTTTSRSTT